MFKILLLCLLTCCSSFIPKQSEEVIEDHTQVSESYERKVKYNLTSNDDYLCISPVELITSSDFYNSNYFNNGLTFYNAGTIGFTYTLFTNNDSFKRVYAFEVSGNDYGFSNYGVSCSLFKYTLTSVASLNNNRSQSWNVTLTFGTYSFTYDIQIIYDTQSNTIYGVDYIDLISFSGNTSYFLVINDSYLISLFGQGRIDKAYYDGYTSGKLNSGGTYYTVENQTGGLTTYFSVKNDLANSEFLYDFLMADVRSSINDNMSYRSSWYQSGNYSWFPVQNGVIETIIGGVQKSPNIQITDIRLEKYNVVSRRDYFNTIDILQCYYHLYFDSDLNGQYYNHIITIDFSIMSPVSNPPSNNLFGGNLPYWFESCSFTTSINTSYALQLVYIESSLDDTDFQSPFNLNIVRPRMRLIEESEDGNYDLGYNEGYDKGFNLGKQFGDQNGYQRGYDDGVTFGEGTGYQEGYQSGQIAGYDDGYDSGQNAGYQVGYASGLEQAQQSETLALQIFTGVVEVGLLPVNVFLKMFEYEVFGINIAGFVSALMTIAIVVIIIRMVTGKKND